MNVSVIVIGHHLNKYANCVHALLQLQDSGGSVGVSGNLEESVVTLRLPDALVPDETILDGILISDPSGHSNKGIPAGVEVAFDLLVTNGSTMLSQAVKVNGDGSDTIDITAGSATLAM